MLSSCFHKKHMNAYARKATCNSQNAHKMRSKWIVFNCIQIILQCLQIFMQIFCAEPRQWFYHLIRRSHRLRMLRCNLNQMLMHLFFSQLQLQSHSNASAFVSESLFHVQSKRILLCSHLHLYFACDSKQVMLPHCLLLYLHFLLILTKHLCLLVFYVYFLSSLWDLWLRRQML